MLFRKLLRDNDVDLARDNEDFKVTCRDGRLTIDRVFSEVAIAAKQPFECSVDGRSLKKLSRICGMLEDQPLLVTFGDLDRINLHIQI